jgi:Helix-turn-helix domain
MAGMALSVSEREEISRRVFWGESFTAIARRLGRPTSTVSREVNRNGGRLHYRAWRSTALRAERARRPGPASSSPTGNSRPPSKPSWPNGGHHSKSRGGCAATIPDDPLHAVGGPARGQERRARRPAHLQADPHPAPQPCDGPLPGTRAASWAATSSSASPPAARSTSATPTAPGNDPPTTTPTGSNASTSPRAPT